MAKRRLIIAAPISLLLGALLASSGAQAESPSRVQMIANACAVCHGTDGRGSKKIPKLRGELEIKDFVLTMKGFKTGEEKSTLMDRIAKGFTDEDIELLAEYFADLKE